MQYSWFRLQRTGDAVWCNWPPCNSHSHLLGVQPGLLLLFRLGHPVPIFLWILYSLHCGSTRVIPLLNWKNLWMAQLLLVSAPYIISHDLSPPLIILETASAASSWALWTVNIPTSRDKHRIQIPDLKPSLPYACNRLPAIRAVLAARLRRIDRGLYLAQLSGLNDAEKNSMFLNAELTLSTVKVTGVQIGNSLQQIL